MDIFKHTTAKYSWLATGILSMFFSFIVSPSAGAQNVAFETNALYWATTTPNIGMEIGLSPKTTFQVFYGLNPWKEGSGDHSSLRHWLLQPEFRYWFCQRFTGWFIGAHALGGEYNAGAVKLPFGFFPSLEDHRYKGWYVGGGIAAGYQWVLSKRWNIEASLGAGYVYTPYDKSCNCNYKLDSGHYNYLGVTKVAVSIVYLIN